MLNRIPFAALLFLINQKIGMVQGKFFCEFKGVVGAAVLHNDDFGGVILLLQETENFLKRARQAALFIMSRDNDG